MEESAAIIVVRPWSRQACDTDESWEAFQQYRDLRPPRRQKAVIGYRTEKLSDWYNVCAWPERVAAFDAHMESVAQAERESYLREKVRDTKARHLAMLHTASDLVQRELDKLVADLRKQQASCAATGGLLKPLELTKFLELVIKYERLVNGESTENNAHIHADLSKLSIDELRQLREIRRKIDAQDQEEQDPVPALQDVCGEPDGD